MTFEFLKVFLPIIIYILLIVLLSIGIVLLIKAVKTMDKVDKIVGSVSDKLESLNGIFHLIDFATDRVTDMTDRAVERISGIISRFIHKHNKRKEEK